MLITTMTADYIDFLLNRVFTILLVLHRMSAGEKLVPSRTYTNSASVLSKSNNK